MRLSHRIRRSRSGFNCYSLFIFDLCGRRVFRTGRAQWDFFDGAEKHRVHIDGTNNNDNCRRRRTLHHKSSGFVCVAIAFRAGSCARDRGAGSPLAFPATAHVYGKCTETDRRRFPPRRFKGRTFASRPTSRSVYRQRTSMFFYPNFVFCFYPTRETIGETSSIRPEKNAPNATGAGPNHNQSRRTAVAVWLQRLYRLLSVGVFIVANNKIANCPCNRVLKIGLLEEGLRSNDIRATTYLNWSGQGLRCDLNSFKIVEMHRNMF